MGTVTVGVIGMTYAVCFVHGSVQVSSLTDDHFFPLSHGSYHNINKQQLHIGTSKAMHKHYAA